MQDSNLEISRHLFASRLSAHSQTDWAIGDQAKTWTQQPVPMMSEHSAHLTSLSFGFRTWLWRYTFLLLLISMLWYRQAIFESKGDNINCKRDAGDKDYLDETRFCTKLFWIVSCSVVSCLTLAFFAIVIRELDNTISKPWILGTYLLFLS